MKNIGQAFNAVPAQSGGKALLRVLIVRGDPIFNNFLEVNSVEADLYDLKHWAKHRITEVHVIAMSVGFVCKSPFDLKKQMQQLENKESSIPEALQTQIKKDRFEHSLKVPKA